MEKLKRCPFCGDRSVDNFHIRSGSKWGCVKCSCGAMGPNVRTQYDDSKNAKWHQDAIDEWNTRKVDPERKEKTDDLYFRLRLYL